MISLLNLPVPLLLGDGPVLLRRATSSDLDAVIELLADDAISAGRGDLARDEDRTMYAAALDRIIADGGNDLLVVEDSAGAVIGTLQLTWIPGMARRGSSRLLVEAVRVSSAHRARGVGTAFMRWVTDQAALDTQVQLVQLTSDAARVSAHRFYQRLGFIDSHIGFKYPVPRTDNDQPPYQHGE